MTYKMPKWLFMTLSFTWGIVLSLIGGIVFLVLCPFQSFKKYDNCIYFEIGKDWGGIELGWLFIVNKNPTTYVKNHELGHGYQNCYLGPFFLILWVWGILRYWYRALIVKINKNIVLKPYNSLWFEHWAEDIGDSIYER